jgi:class 3 adenylate cyclase/dienelactone hydrolase
VGADIRYASNDGVNIAYAVIEGGPASLLVVPGFISNVELALEDPEWSAWADRLARFARVVLFDKRGTGLSDRPERDGDRSLDVRMQDARAVADAAGLEPPFSILGISEGGPMALLFAATYPERTRSLVLFGSTPRACTAPDWPWGLDSDFLASFADAVAEQWGTGITADLFAGDRANVRRDAQARLERQGTSPAGYRETMRVFADIDVRDVLPSIRVPTLVVHGERDITPVDVARYVAAKIPDAQLDIFDGVHSPPLAPAGVWDDVERFITGVAPSRTFHRTLATLLFTDVVASTAKAEELGDAAWRRLLERHDAVFRSHLEHFRGTEVKHTGDGFLATFDGPGRAVECALAVVDAMRATGIEIRAGLHTGEIERRDDDVAGIAVHVAARVAALAAPSEALVSRTVRDLVAGSPLRFTDRGTHALKGIADSWQLYAAST